MKGKGNFKVPFTPVGGRMLRRVTYKQVPDWRDNTEFYTTLRFATIIKERSSTYVVFYDDEANPYYMFLTDFNQIVYDLKEGELTGCFTFVKKGDAYGVKYLRPIKQKGE